MTRRHPVTSLALVTVAALAAMAGSAPAAAAGPAASYVAHELTGPDRLPMRAAAINASLQFAGQTAADGYFRNTSATLGSTAGDLLTFTMYGNDNSAGLAISSNGWVGGYDYPSRNALRRGLVRSPQGELTDPFAGEKGSFVTVYGVNADGVAVGDHDLVPNSGATQAFRWTAAGGVEWLGTLGGAESHANAINDAGTIAGWSTTAGGTARAFRYAGGQMKALPNIFADESVGPDYAYAVNASDVVVGKCGTNNVTFVACRWTPGARVPARLGTLVRDSRALAINASGLAVGDAQDISSVWRAVVFDKGRALDLNLLTIDLPRDVVLDVAVSVNDAGWIAVDGHDGRTQRHYLLEPVAAGR